MSDQSDSEAALDPNFIETIGILEKNDILYWVCHGTLLGLVRDKRLIPWDHDIDIGVWADSVSKASVIDLMTGHGYALKSDGEGYDYIQFVKAGGREVDFNLYHISQDSNMAYSEWFISRSNITSFLEALAQGKKYNGRLSRLVERLKILRPLLCFAVGFLKKRGLLYKSAGYTTPAELFKEFKLIEVSGLKISVPMACEAVLEFIYGSEWRTPKQQYDWAKESPAPAFQIPGLHK